MANSNHGRMTTVYRARVRKLWILKGKQINVPAEFMPMKEGKLYDQLNLMLPPSCKEYD